MNKTQRAGQARLEKAASEAMRLWTLACLEDGIDPHAKFVVFSNENKYRVPCNEAATLFGHLSNLKRRGQGVWAARA